MRQSGQALVPGMLLLAAGVLVWVYFYNGSQVIAARGRLTHTADAMAYSAALVQARTLNFHAYINRTQLAHQVAMAHVVTLAAWARLGSTQARQVGRGNPPATLIGMMFGPAHAVAYRSSRAATAGGTGDDAPADLAQAYGAHERAVHEILSRSRQQLLATARSSRDSALQAVLAANHPVNVEQRWPGELPAVQWLTDDWQDAARPFSALRDSGVLGLLGDMQRRYGFLHPRDHTARNTWAVQRRCPMKRHELRRRGRTQLDETGRWQAHDTQSYHALRSNRWIGCYYREYPMGWGRVQPAGKQADDLPQHSDDAPEDFSAEDFWRWAARQADWDILEGRDNALANSYAIGTPLRLGGRGLPVLSTLNPERAEGIRIAFALRQRASDLPTTPKGSSHVRIGPGELAFTAFQEHEGMTVHAAAETYFARPVARRDGRLEGANLFHPYWQARLRAVSETEWRRQSGHASGAPAEPGQGGRSLQ
ncbi:MAG: hypothetical protein ABN482_07885 [Corticimicrobacter sp.]|uniref:hypothetical protein n=1 Tax=Corticimicrobacter sp. TaxID=2678536 RepID=UPI0032DA1066